MQWISFTQDLCHPIMQKQGEKGYVPRLENVGISQEASQISHT